MGKPKNIELYISFKGCPTLKMALCWVAFFCKKATLVRTSQEISRASFLFKPTFYRRSKTQKPLPMVWAWMLWSSTALETRTELWFGHGCSGRRMLLEHERNYGLGMDALVAVCSWNTNGLLVWNTNGVVVWAWMPYGIMVWGLDALGTELWFEVWMLWTPYALGTRTESWFGHGCSGRRMLLEHEQNHGLGMDALVAVCSWNTNGIMVWAWMLWSPYALGTRTELWFGHGCSGRRMRLEHERNYGLGMDALVIDCTWNMNRIMVWAWMLWSSYALGTRTKFWFWHGCSGRRMRLEHERNYGLGMDALVALCSWNTNGIMVWAWMLWSSTALGTRTELWFGHGCSGRRMLLEHERNFGFGMDALVAVCAWNTNGIMVRAWMLRFPSVQHEECPGYS